MKYMYASALKWQESCSSVQGVPSKAQEAFHSVEVHTMATSIAWQGVWFRFSCSSKEWGHEGKREWRLWRDEKEKHEQQRMPGRIQEGGGVGGERMKMKRGLMRQSRTTRDSSSHEKPAHTDWAFGRAVTQREGQNLPSTGALVHISISTDSWK